MATLLLPPDLYAPRRILIPFGGVCSEAIGALLAGWDEIVAVEMDETYCQIGEARMEWWARQYGLGLREVDEILATLNRPKEEAPIEQLAMF